MEPINSAVFQIRRAWTRLAAAGGGIGQGAVGRKDYRRISPAHAERVPDRSGRSTNTQRFAGRDLQPQLPGEGRRPGINRNQSRLYPCKIQVTAVFNKKLLNTGSQQSMTQHFGDGAGNGSHRPDAGFRGGGDHPLHQFRGARIAGPGLEVERKSGYREI